MSGLRILAVVLAAAPWTAWTAPAEAAPRCPGRGETAEIAVHVNTGTMTLDTRRDAAYLERIRRRHGSRVTRPRGHPLGLTVAGFRFDMTTQVKVYPLGKGLYCGVPSTVTITIGYPDFQVYVLRRYRRDSCEYEAILAHEKTHVRLYRDTVEGYAADVKQSLANAVRRFEPVMVKVPRKAADAVQARLRRDIGPELEDMGHAGHMANARIDTPESYRAVQDLCDNW